MSDPKLIESAALEDVVFFKRLGEVTFCPDSEEIFPNRGGSLVVAKQAGIVCFADACGLYVAYTRDILKAVQKWDKEAALPPLPPSGVCKAVLPAPFAALALSQDEKALLVSVGSRCSIHSVSTLLKGGVAASEEIHFKGDEISQVAMTDCNTDDILFVLASGSLHIGKGSMNKIPCSVPGKVECAAWSPDGAYVAVGTQDTLYFLSKDTAFSIQRSIKLCSNDVREEDSLLIDTLCWDAPQRVFVNCQVVENGTALDLAPHLILSWSGGPLPAPESAKVVELFPSNIVSDASEERVGPLLNNVFIPEWNVSVYAHRQAADDHVKVAALMEEELDGGCAAVDVTDDRLAIRIPNALHDEENFVVGIGVDLTSVGMEVSHPTDPNEPDLPPQPILLVLTSDSVLRVYTVGNLTFQGSIVKAVPNTEQAIAAALPLDSESDDERLKEEDKTVAKEGISPQAQKQLINVQDKSFESVSAQQLRLTPPVRLTETPESSAFLMKSQGVLGPGMKHKTQVDAPIAFLNKGAKEAAHMETEFLSSLLATRKLEAELYDALVESLHGKCRASQHEHVISAMVELERVHDVSELRDQMNMLTDRVKGAVRRCDAMPLFRSGSIASTAKAREQLFSQQPLDAALCTIRDALYSQLSLLKTKAEEINSSLEALDAQYRNVATSKEGSPTAPQAFYDAVNAQGVVVRALISKMERLREIALSTGVIPIERSRSEREALYLIDDEGEDLPFSPKQSDSASAFESPINILSTSSGRKNWKDLRASPSLDTTNVGMGLQRHVEPLSAGEDSLGKELIDKIMPSCQYALRIHNVGEPSESAKKMRDEGMLLDIKKLLSPTGVGEVDLVKPLVSEGKNVEVDNLMKPHMTASRPPIPIPSSAQMKEASKLIEKVQPPKQASFQPPIPSSAQMKEASKLIEKVQPPKQASFQPPIPSSAQMKEASKLTVKEVQSHTVASEATKAECRQEIMVSELPTFEMNSPPKGFSFGDAAASGAPTGIFGAPLPSSSPAFGFGSAAASGAPTGIFGAPPPSSSPAFGFGSAAESGAPTGIFGAPPPSSNPSYPAMAAGFMSQPAFGSMSTFGTPTAFGGASPSAAPSPVAFGQSTGFGQATSPALFGAFGQPAAASGGFASFGAPQAGGSGFAAFAQQGGLGLSSSSTPKPASAVWQPRK